MKNRCVGLGTVDYFEPRLIAPNRGLSLNTGALLPWAESKHFQRYEPALRALGERHGFTLSTPLEDFSDAALACLFYGEDEKGRPAAHSSGLRRNWMGGNVAMDAARSALRLGAETVYIVYRRGMAELPARKEEVEHAVEEGIIFKTLSNPVEVLGDADGSVCGMRCVEMELGEPDASGRRRPVVKEGSEFVLEVDCMVMSIGTSPNPLIRSTTPGLETNSHGCIITNGDDGLTTRNAVYAGGDAVTGAATVILAMGAGKHAAKAIDEYAKYLAFDIVAGLMPLTFIPLGWAPWDVLVMVSGLVSLLVLLGLLVFARRQLFSEFGKQFSA